MMRLIWTELREIAWLFSMIGGLSLVSAGVAVIALLLLGAGSDGLRPAA